MPVCMQCGSHDLFEAAVTIPAGAVHFVHCRTCAYRCWTDASRVRVLALDEVLAR